MAVEGSSNVIQCKEVLSQISTMVDEAKKYILRSDMCLIRRQDLMDKVLELQQSIPSALDQAARIVDEESTIRTEAQQQAEATKSAAQAEADRIAAQSRSDYEAAQQQIQQAQAMLAQIQREGEQLREQLTQEAQNQANSIVEDGRRQAQKIVSDAEADAARLVENESVYRRAQIAAQEMTENATAQVNQMRQQTFGFLDDMLGKAERYVGSLVSDVHQERENLNSMR